MSLELMIASAIKRMDGTVCPASVALALVRLHDVFDAQHGRLTYDACKQLVAPLLTDDFVEYVRINGGFDSKEVHPRYQNWETADFFTSFGKYWRNFSLRQQSGIKYLIHLYLKPFVESWYENVLMTMVNNIQREQKNERAGKKVAG